MYITNEPLHTKISRNDFSNGGNSPLEDASNNTARMWSEEYNRHDPVKPKQVFSSNKENGGKVSPIYENVPRHFSASSSGSSRESDSSGKPLVGILKVPGTRKHYFTKHVEFLEDHDVTVRQF